MKKLFSETIIYGIGAILPRIIYFLLNPFFIHFIKRDEFAQFTNLYAMTAYVNVVLQMGFETSFFRYSAERENEKKAFYTSFWFLFFTSGLFLFLVLIFNQPIASFLHYDTHPEYIRWFALIAFFENICIIPLAWLRFNGMPIKYSAVRVAQVLLQVLCVLSLFLFVPKSWSESIGMKTQVSYAFASNLFACIMGVLFLSPIFLKVRFRFSKTLFKRMIKYSYPVMLAGLAFMINENFDKTVQYYLISPTDAGAYGGCYKLAVLMTLFVTAYRMGVEPFFFKEMGKENPQSTYAKVTEYFSVFGSIVAFGIIANIGWLKVLFIPNSKYWVSINIVPIIVIGNLCFGIYYSLSAWYKVTDRTVVGTFISWSGAVITIVLNLGFLKTYGFMISAWATWFVYFFMMVFSYFLGQKYYPVPYRVKKIGMILITLGVFSFVSYKLFDADIIIGNLMFVLFVGIIAYSEREMLARLVKREF